MWKALKWDWRPIRTLAITYIPPFYTINFSRPTLFYLHIHWNLKRFLVSQIILSLVSSNVRSLYRDLFNYLTIPINYCSFKFSSNIDFNFYWHPDLDFNGFLETYYACWSFNYQPTFWYAGIHLNIKKNHLQVNLL